MRYRTLITCPKCHTPKVGIRSSRDQGDGSRMEYWRCRVCAERFEYVAEMPDLHDESFFSKGEDFVVGDNGAD